MACKCNFISKSTLGKVLSGCENVIAWEIHLQIITL